VAELRYQRWFPALFTAYSLPYIQNEMADRTETLTVGLQAPEFSLTAANREGIFSLAALRAKGAVVLEFLRGTW
jgi:hypothetical protein